MTTWKPPDDIDPEVVPLCTAMIALPGIVTTSSCCGHGKDSFRIWFAPASLDALPDLLYWFDQCHSGCSGWRVTTYTDCGMSPATFMLEGPAGAYGEADKIAVLMAAHAEELRMENAGAVGA